MTILTNAEPMTTRKPKGRMRRAVTLSTKITPRELDLISAASEADGRTLGEWVREALLKAARASTLELGTNHLMTEIVALQLFLTDVFSSVACCERMSAEGYEQLMKNVKANKERAAREVIGQYLSGKGEERHV